MVKKNYDDMLSCFHLIPEVRYRRTAGQTDRQTDRSAISISRVSMLTRDKNRPVSADQIRVLLFRLDLQSI